MLDVDERLRDVESQFSSLKDVMNESLAERKTLEGVVELSKSRGMPFSPLHFIRHTSFETDTRCTHS